MPVIRSIAFPFMSGSQSFPREANDFDAIKSSIIQIICTGKTERCFAGDTLIPLLDGKEGRIDELVGKEFWVYAIDRGSGLIAPGRATAFVSGMAKELVAVHLDNGETIRCTPSHQIMLRDGSYRHASGLISGDSLMPLYRKVSTVKQPHGYEMAMICDGSWRFTHRMVAESLSMVAPDRPIVHHKNCNKFDNSPDNLMGVSGREHSKIHKAVSDRLNSDPEIRERSKLAHQAKWDNDPEWAEAQRRRLSDLASKTNSRYSPEERKARARHANLALQTNPMHAEARERTKTANIGRKHGREFCERMSQAQKDSWERSWDTRLIPALGNLARANQDNFGVKRRCESILAKYKERNSCIIPTRETWTRWVLDSIRDGTIKRQAALSWDVVSKYLPEVASPNNHKVLSVETVSLPAPVPVYDIEVDGYHNFALSSGVFVHNCMRGQFGCGAFDFVFENDSDMFRIQVEREVRSALTKWEPRVSVDSIEISNGDIAEPGQILITINYSVNNADYQDSVTVGG